MMLTMMCLGKGSKLLGSTEDTKGAMYAETLRDLMSHGWTGDVRCLDAEHKGRKPQGPQEHIIGAWVAVQGHASNDEPVNKMNLDAEGKCSKLHGPTATTQEESQSEPNIARRRHLLSRPVPAPTCLSLAQLQLEEL